MKTKHTLFSTSVLTAGAAIAVLGLGIQPAAACGDGAYIGQICIMAGSYCPANTVEPMGQLIAITGNEALYSLLGCTYGGDCRTSMGIPDLRGRAPTGYGTGPGLTGHPWGQMYGEEEVVQTVAMLANHNHAATFTPVSDGTSGTEAQVLVSTGAGETNSPAGGKYLSAASATTMKIYNSGTTGELIPLEGVSGGGGGGGGGVVAIGDTGDANPIPIVPPSIAMRYCIVTGGLYPPRPSN